MTPMLLPSPAAERAMLSDWLKVRAGDWTWRVKTGWEAIIKNPAMQAPGFGGAVLKRGMNRTITRVESVRGPVYVKQFHPGDWRTKFRQACRGGQARWEFSRYRRAKAAGVPTADVIAVGRSRHGGTALITQGIAGAKPLDQWSAAHLAELDLATRRTLMRELGSFLAGLCQQGVFHGDLHAGNVLVRQNQFEFRFWIVDLTPLRFSSRPIRGRRAVDMLSRVRHSLLSWITATDQTAVWRTFANSGTPSDLSQRRNAVWQRCQEKSWRYWRHVDRSWFRGCRDVLRVRTESLEFRASATAGHEWLNFVADVFSEATDLCGSPTLPSALKKLGLEVATSPHARREWELGHALLRRGIAVNAAVGVAEPRNPGSEQGWLLFANEAGWWNLTEFFDADPVICRQIGNRVIDLYRTLHQHGFFYEQLNAAAFEVRPSVSGYDVRLAKVSMIRQLRTVWPRRRHVELQMMLTDISQRIRVSRSQILRWWKRSEGPVWSGGVRNRKRMRLIREAA